MPRCERFAKYGLNLSPQYTGTCYVELGSTTIYRDLLRWVGVNDYRYYCIFLVDFTYFKYFALCFVAPEWPRPGVTFR